MADTSDIPHVTSVPRAKISRRGLPLDGWGLLGLAIATLVVLPIATVFYLALFPEENIWPHLISTTLPRYMENSLVMMAGVGLLAG